jgi:hypothetical protein
MAEVSARLQSLWFSLDSRATFFARAIDMSRIISGNIAWRSVAVFAAFLFALAGCTGQLAPPTRSGEPIGVQLMRAEPMFVGAPFRVLLDFESASDLAFVSTSSISKLDPVIKLDSEVAHTGGASLQVPAGAKGSGFVVKLSALLPTNDFPGLWTLIGGYFISREATSVQIDYLVGGKSLLHRSVNLEPRKWTPVFLDFSTLSDPNANAPSEVGVLSFTTGNAAVWCDDIVAFDNASLFVGDADKAGDGWTVRRRGFITIIEKPGSFKLRIPSPEAASEGWRVEEANELRVRMMNSTGKREWTVYSDGREYLDGKFQSAIELPAEQLKEMEAQQASPAELSVPEEFGRVERNAPGDRNNDGYAEASGAYQLKANGARFEATITPRTAKLVRPVLEIAGLPAGRVMANLEGRLIEKSVRLPNGHVLIELPATINRPVTVNLRVQPQDR